MNFLFKHSWEATDSQGHSLCCDHCGKEIYFTTEEYNQTLDAVCPQQIALLRAEEVISRLSDAEVHNLSLEGHDFKRYLPSDSQSFLSRFEFTRQHFEAAQEEADNSLNLPIFFEVVNGVLIQRMKSSLMGGLV